MGLYDELNRLIRTNGLRNTSGPSYTSLDTLGSKTTGTNAASTRWQSVYPGIGVSLTVEGPYQNLRRFVRDLEANRQFIIINAIELERATETNSTVSVGGASARVAGFSRQLTFEHGHLLSAWHCLRTAQMQSDTDQPLCRWLILKIRTSERN